MSNDEQATRPDIHPQIVLGVDLGDAETEVAKVTLGRHPPALLPMEDGSRIIPTIIGFDRSDGGATVIGRAALELDDYFDLGVSVKKRPTAGPKYLAQRKLDSIALFLRVLFDEAILPQLGEPQERLSIWLGCPSSWTDDDRDLYREALTAKGFADIKLVSESGAIALVVAEDEGFREAFDPALVIDIGSSTTDFTEVTALEPTDLPFGDDFGVNKLDERLARVAAELGGRPLALATRREPSFAYLTMLCRIWREMAAGRPVDYPFAGRAADDDTLSEGLEILQLALAVFESAEFAARARAETAAWKAELETLLTIVHRKTGDVARIILVGGGALLPGVPDIVRGVYGNNVRSAKYELTVVADGLARLGRWRLRKDELKNSVARILDADEFASATGAIVDRHLARAADRFGPALANLLLQVFAKTYQKGALWRANVDASALQSIWEDETRKLLASPEFASISRNELDDARVEIERYYNAKFGAAFDNVGGVTWAPIRLDLTWSDIFTQTFFDTDFLDEIRTEIREVLDGIPSAGRWLTEKSLDAIGSLMGKPMQKYGSQITSFVVTMAEIFEEDPWDDLKNDGIFGSTEKLQIGRKVAAQLRDVVAAVAHAELVRVAPFLARTDPRKAIGPA